MLHGIINVYKEQGYTSHDVVAKLRGILKQKKIGHTGTLDPDAEGVLPVCLGKGTKLCDMMLDRDKICEAVLLLGTVTDTQDISGKVLKEQSVEVSEDEVRTVIMGFEGPYEQIPPMYSALKVNGKKLYEYAREGIEIERKPRMLTIYSIEIVSIDLPRVSIRVSCSKGTYIRTLCHDIGNRLGCGACMESLKRIKAGEFLLKDSRKLCRIEELAGQGRIEEVLIPIDSMFLSYKKVVVDKKYQKLVDNGNAFMEMHIKQGSEMPPADAPFRVYDENKRFIGIYEYRKEKKQYMPVKIFLGQE